jgi:hypothetical protein
VGGDATDFHCSARRDSPNRECSMANEAIHVPVLPMVTQRSLTLKDVPCDQQERIVAPESRYLGWVRGCAACHTS